MRLSTYIQLHAVHRPEFARKVGISEAMLSRLLSGDRKPSLATMQAIAFVTQGAVKPDDWLDGETEGAQS